MGLMDLFRRRKDVPEPEKGGPDGRFQVLGDDGTVRWFTPDDFDEIFTTTEEHEAARHVKIGWLLLDEAVGRGHGPGHIDFVVRPVSTGGMGGLSMRTVPVDRGPDDETTYVLGYLKPGRTGQLS
jgi:hypothetical protein